MRRLAEERILQEIRRFDPNAQADVVSENKAIVRVDNEFIPLLIGKSGATITKLEEKLGIHIDVEPSLPTMGKEVQFLQEEVGNHIDLYFDKNLTGEMASIYVENEFLFSATIGKNGRLRVIKNSDLGRWLVRAIVQKKKIRAII